uniref:Phosphomannomutase/phosphoglucomutase n=1 Tax=candidate division WOR-3 bacterium TaxID=2052148 RepID=A0A7C4UB81_UNCW3
MKDEIFRMYDIRGIAETELTDDVVELIGKSYGTLVRNKGIGNEIVVGYDARKTSPRIKDALCKGIISTGINIVDIGMCPTPLLYFAVFHYSLSGGVMVTGSHNPKEYNGLKMMIGEETLYGDDIQKIKEIARKKEFKEGKGIIKKKNVEDDYIEKILSITYPKRKLKIVLDPGNGTAGALVSKIFNIIGADFECIFCEPDGEFPNHLPDPTIPEYMESLKKKVLETKADFGIGYDGDADRIGVIDDKGDIVWGDKLLCIFSDFVLKRYPNSYIIFDVKSSQGAAEFIEGKGGRPFMWKTGHSLIKAKMKELNSPLAGEMSGHIFFGGDYYGYDDAIFASLRLYDILSNSDKKISEIVKNIPYYFSTPEIRIETTEEKKWKLVEEVKKHFSKTNKIIDIDGARILFGDGWGLVRASNTQPVIVARFEARSKERCEEIKNIVMEFINEKR